MKSLVFLALITMTTITPALAGQSVSLPEAVRQGLRNNNLLKAEQFTVQAATAGQAVATSRYLPRLLFEDLFLESFP